MSKEKSGRGGVHAGAGRKPKPPQRARRITITLPPNLSPWPRASAAATSFRKRSTGIATALELWQWCQPQAAQRASVWRALEGARCTPCQ